MIAPTLQCIVNELNSSLQKQFALSESAVVLSPVVEGNGNMPVNNQNKVVVTLLNLEAAASHAVSNNPPGSHLQVPAVNFNIVFLVSVNFSDYAEALKFCDAVTSFFQENPVFDQSSFPSMPAEGERFQVVFQSLSLQEMQDLWKGLGVSYQPSMVYRVVG